MRRPTTEAILLFLAVLLLLAGCSPLVHRTRTTICYCSACGRELSRTEQQVTLRRSELTGFQQVIEDHTGRCELVGTREETRSCPACFRRFVVSVPVSVCEGKPPLADEHDVPVGDQPCAVCQAWEQVTVAAEPAMVVDGVTVVGPFDAGASIEWAAEDTAWVRAGYDGIPDMVVELTDAGDAQGWAARRLFAWPEGSGLYSTVPLLGGKSLLAVADMNFWLCEVPDGVGDRFTACRLGQGLVARPSPNLDAAVLYFISPAGEPPLYCDFASGLTERWTAVPSMEFPLTSAGCVWSPAGDRYLYASRGFGLFVQPVPAGDPVPVSTPGETAFHGQWSPDGRLVAYLSFEGDPSPYHWPDDDLAVPYVWEALKVRSLAEEGAHRLAVDGRMVLTHGPCWAPDGRTVAFAAGGIKDPDYVFGWEAWGDVYVSRLTAAGWSKPSPLTGDGENGCVCRPVEWSPDGSSLLVSVGRSHGTSAHRVISVADGTAGPIAGPVVQLDGVRAASWLDDGRLIVVVAEEWKERLEIRSRSGAVLKVLDRPDVSGGRRSRIDYRLSPACTRVVWVVNVWSPDPGSQDRGIWIKARGVEAP